jgi:glycosyltransferase involved in cell wall biosynthesis
MPHDIITSEGGDAGMSEAARLAAENAVLRARLARAEASASVQAMRAGALAWDAGNSRLQLRLMRASSFWRLTMPLRLVLDLARGAPETGSPQAVLVRRFFATARRNGIGAAVAQARAWQRRRARARAAEPRAVAVDGAAVGPAEIVPASHVLAPHVLIVAELSVPQCAKYRVWQKQEHFTRIGVPCRVVDWHDKYGCRGAASLATQAILYRVPARPEILSLIELLESLGVDVRWEVDDLIFDEGLYRQNSNLLDLPVAVQENLLEGVRLYRQAMLRVGRAIASTSGLAAAMRAACVADVQVVENALDAETLVAAGEIRAARAARAARADVLIMYGSGTKTHDADFRLAAPALARLLRARTEVRLRIVGDLTVPPEILVFGARVERIGALPYQAFLALLGEADISIAPLEPTIFNDAKSSIKYLEAAILGVASVCSPRASFAEVIEPGVNGLMADDDAAWFAALDALAADAALRERLGQAALNTALERFSPERIARNDVARLVVPDARPRPALRVMFANVFFAPRSYGGATLVVEEMAARLAADPHTDVHVVTTVAPGEPPNKARRAQGLLQVHALPAPDGDFVGEFDNPEAGEGFGRVLDAVQPDVVHLHSVQRLSASLADACLARGIPYVITLHDAWWVCARQFMVRADGRYCFQKRIDLHICQACNPDMKHLHHRQELLRGALDGAALLLSPSEAHRALYLAQGIAPARIEVAPNGVRLPAGTQPRPSSGPLRFGYVGGFEPVKGYEVLHAAMEGLQRADWELVLVDNTLNLGFSSVDVAQWRVRGKLSVVPAYAQDGLDAFFAGIDVLLFPSQWKESFGLTVREALLRDVWVVATDGGGAAEAVTDGVNGTLIPLDGDAARLRAVIEDLLDNPARVRGFRNPLKESIIGFDEQAAALRQTLMRVAVEGKGFGHE